MIGLCATRRAVRGCEGLCLRSSGRAGGSAPVGSAMARFIGSCHSYLMNQRQGHLAAIARNMTTTSAMNPVLLLCLIICPICLVSGGVMLARGNLLGLIFMAFAGAPLLIACWQIVYFTMIAPDRLQREQHVEKMAAMRHAILQKTDAGLLELPVSAGALTSNPALEEVRGE
jgi:hypothetical protein